MKTFPQRKSPRLQGYDYSASGAYFVTICTHLREHLFGTIETDTMFISEAGETAADCWYNVSNHYPDIELDAFVVMPNHVHGILVFHGTAKVFKTMLGRVINAYKGAVTARLRQQQPEMMVWQGRYHDHIIRNEASLNQIRNYVLTNPMRWRDDKFFSE